MKRLPAFTLLEGVLSLFLLAVLGMCAAYAIQAIQRSAGSMAGRSGLEQEILYLNAALRTDLDHADVVLATDEHGLECRIDSSVIRYSVFPDGIRRSDADGDTIRFTMPIAEATTTTVDDDVPLVQLWRIHLQGSTTNELAYHKTYAPADILRSRYRHAHQDPH